MILKAKKLGDNRYGILNTKICITKEMLLGAVAHAIRHNGDALTRIKIITYLKGIILTEGTGFWLKYAPESKTEAVIVLSKKYFPDWFGENSQQFIMEK